MIAGRTCLRTRVAVGEDRGIIIWIRICSINSTLGKEEDSSVIISDMVEENDLIYLSRTEKQLVSEWQNTHGYLVSRLISKWQFIEKAIM
mmetsp:Transcript_14993/g.24214  ORF Transcript_14993/g.24214 Transcript_14993/m.24214 type:complete len:90 (-) Transcript_14993:51-320(-)